MTTDLGLLNSDLQSAAGMAQAARTVALAGDLEGALERIGIAMRILGRAAAEAGDSGTRSAEIIAEARADLGRTEVAMADKARRPIDVSRRRQADASGLADGWRMLPGREIGEVQLDAPDGYTSFHSGADAARAYAHKHDYWRGRYAIGEETEPEVTADDVAAATEAGDRAYNEWRSADWMRDALAADRRRVAERQRQAPPRPVAAGGPSTAADAADAVAQLLRELAGVGIDPNVAPTIHGGPRRGTPSVEILVNGYADDVQTAREGLEMLRTIAGHFRTPVIERRPGIEDRLTVETVVPIGAIAVTVWAVAESPELIAEERDRFASEAADQADQAELDERDRAAREGPDAAEDSVRVEEVHPLIAMGVYPPDAPRCVTCGNPYSKLEAAAGMVTCEHCPAPTDAQLEGWDCIRCGADFGGGMSASVPVGAGPRGQLFACTPACPALASDDEGHAHADFDADGGRDVGLTADEVVALDGPAVGLGDGVSSLPGYFAEEDMA
jgi:hypothetical protein